MIPSAPDAIPANDIGNTHGLQKVACDGSTTIFDKDKNGDYKKKVVMPSVENTIAMFNNPHPHFGTTQNDTQTRIVLNTNIMKANVDPFADPDKITGEVERLDDYF